MQPQYYRHKQTGVVVAALQLTEQTAGEIANWTQSQLVEERDSISHEESPGVNVKTPAGIKRASVGDFVVKYSGAFFVGRPGLFESDYERVKP